LLAAPTRAAPASELGPPSLPPPPYRRGFPPITMSVTKSDMGGGSDGGTRPLGVVYTVTNSTFVATVSIKDGYPIFIG
jgi:hypothetical protein